MVDVSNEPSTAASQAAASKLVGMCPPTATAGPAASSAAAAPAAGASDKDAAKAAKAAAKTAKAAAKAAKVKGKPKGKEGAADGEKKKKPIKPIAIGFVLLIVAHTVVGKVVKPHYGPKNPVPPGAIFDFPGAVTTNLPDGSLAQIGISLQMTKVGSTKIVTKDTSELMGTAVKIIGAQNYATLLSTPGRLALQAALLKAFQGELGMTEGAPAVSQVYFTSYILQQQ